MKSLMFAGMAVFASLLCFACASNPAAYSLESSVARIIDEIPKSEGRGKRAYAELESLGKPAVPYLVAHLDDVRPVAAREIGFVNTAADAFEERRSYSPITVHDALSAILNQITGESFVFVYNGATPAERDENRRRWAEWCRSTYPDRARACGG